MQPRVDRVHTMRQDIYTLLPLRGAQKVPPETEAASISLSNMWKGEFTSRHFHLCTYVFEFEYNSAISRQKAQPTPYLSRRPKNAQISPQHLQTQVPPTTNPTSHSQSQNPRPNLPIPRFSRHVFRMNAIFNKFLSCSLHSSGTLKRAVHQLTMFPFMVRGKAYGSWQICLSLFITLRGPASGSLRICLLLFIHTSFYLFWYANCCRQQVEASVDKQQ